jgi:hypothetical protein
MDRAPRTGRLSAHESAQIRALSAAGKTPRAIARIMYDETGRRLAPARIAAVVAQPPRRKYPRRPRPPADPAAIEARVRQKLDSLIGELAALQRRRR